MKILALGGCGQQGRLAVKTLIEEADVKKVIIADINIEAAKAFQNELDSAKVEVLEIDVLDERSLKAAMQGIDVVANFVGPFFRFAEPIAKAVIASGVNYVDICDDVAPTQTLLDDYHEQAKASGASLLIGMGASPGVSNVLVRRAANQLDQVDSAGVYWSVSANDIETELAGNVDNAAIYEHAIELMAGKAVQFLEGNYTEVQGGSGVEEVEFATLGTQQAYYVSHPEPVTIPRYIKTNNIFNKGCVPGLDEVLFGFQALGLTSHENITVKGTDYKATDLAIAILAYLDANSEPVPESELPACSDLFVEVSGKQGEDSVKIRLDVSTTQGLPRMDRMTGIAAAIGILMMGRGQIEEKGVLAPEGGVDPDCFFAEFSKYDFVIKEKIEAV
jgi:saccharopine dehydrogenase (NAD+, L-lysine-forming)